MNKYSVILQGWKPQTATEGMKLRSNMVSKLGFSHAAIEQIFKKLPAVIKDDLSQDEAKDLYRKMNDLNAVVSIKQSDEVNEQLRPTDSSFSIKLDSFWENPAEETSLTSWSVEEEQQAIELDDFEISLDAEDASLPLPDPLAAPLPEELPQETAEPQTSSSRPVVESSSQKANSFEEGEDNPEQLQEPVLRLRTDEDSVPSSPLRPTGDDSEDNAFRLQQDDSDDFELQLQPAEVEEQQDISFKPPPKEEEFSLELRPVSGSEESGQSERAETDGLQLKESAQQDDPSQQLSSIEPESNPAKEKSKKLMELASALERLKKKSAKLQEETEHLEAEEIQKAAFASPPKEEPKPYRPKHHRPIRKAPKKEVQPVKADESDIVHVPPVSPTAHRSPSVSDDENLQPTKTITLAQRHASLARHAETEREREMHEEAARQLAELEKADKEARKQRQVEEEKPSEHNPAELVSEKSEIAAQPEEPQQREPQSLETSSVESATAADINEETEDGEEEHSSAFAAEIQAAETQAAETQAAETQAEPIQSEQAAEQEELAEREIQALQEPPTESEIEEPQQPEERPEYSLEQDEHRNLAEDSTIPEQISAADENAATSDNIDESEQPTLSDEPEETAREEESLDEPSSDFLMVDEDHSASMPAVSEAAAEPLPPPPKNNRTMITAVSVFAVVLLVAVVGFASMKRSEGPAQASTAPQTVPTSSLATTSNPSETPPKATIGQTWSASAEVKNTKVRLRVVTFGDLIAKVDFELSPQDPVSVPLEETEGSEENEPSGWQLVSITAEGVSSSKHVERKLPQSNEVVKMLVAETLADVKLQKDGLEELFNAKFRLVLERTGERTLRGAWRIASDNAKGLPEGRNFILEASTDGQFRLETRNSLELDLE